MADAEPQKLTIEEECERLKLMGISCDVCDEMDVRRKTKHKIYIKWLAVVTGVLFGFVILYIVLHAFNPGAQNSTLSTGDISVIGDLLSSEQKAVSAYNNGTETVPDVTEEDTASTPADTTKATTAIAEIAAPKKHIDSAYRAVILDYIFTQYPPQEGSVDLSSLYPATLAKGDSAANTAKDTTAQHAINAMSDLMQLHAESKNSALVHMVWMLDSEDLLKALPEVPIATSSYFWLASNSRYWEVIFWSIFGVLCSLLYSGTEYMRKGSFKQKEVYVQVAKFFYTPLCALIIVAGYDYFTFDDDKSNLSLYTSTPGLIVISFILGFFSGSTITLLQRMKEMIFPSTKTDVDETQIDDGDNIDDDSIEQIVTAVNTSVDGLKKRPNATDEDPDETGYEAQNPIEQPANETSESAGDTTPNTDSTGVHTPKTTPVETPESGVEDPDETGYEAPK